jgi:hypothetical protein
MTRVRDVAGGGRETRASRACRMEVATGGATVVVESSAVSLARVRQEMVGVVAMKWEKRWAAVCAEAAEDRRAPRYARQVGGGKEERNAYTDVPSYGWSRGRSGTGMGMGVDMMELGFNVHNVLMEISEGCGRSRGGGRSRLEDAWRRLMLLVFNDRGWLHKRGRAVLLILY